VKFLLLYKNTRNWKTFGKKFVVVCIIIFLAALLIFTNHYQRGLSLENIEGSFPVTIIATENFGKTILFSKELTIEGGDSAMDVLNEVADVTYIHGGGFVESINGAKSQYNNGGGEKKDWLYYINGMLSPVGANMYKMYPGDRERWDFHNWGLDRVTTAIIADYPEPFAHGFNGQIKNTTIVYSNEFYYAAVALQQSLEQYSVSSSIIIFDDLSNNDKTNNNLILIDTYDNELVKELNTNARTLGFFIEFDEGKIKTFDEIGEEQHVFENGGVVLATQNPWNLRGNWNGENVVWIITGITIEDVTNAADVLINNNEDIKNTVSIVVVNEKIYRVP